MALRAVGGGTARADANGHRPPAARPPAGPRRSASPACIMAGGHGAGRDTLPGGGAYRRAEPTELLVAPAAGGRHAAGPGPPRAAPVPGVGVAEPLVEPLPRRTRGDAARADSRHAGARRPRAPVAPLGAPGTLHGDDAGGRSEPARSVAPAGEGLSARGRPGAPLRGARAVARLASRLGRREGAAVASAAAQPRHPLRQSRPRGDRLARRRCSCRELLGGADPAAGGRARLPHPPGSAPMAALGPRPVCPGRVSSRARAALQPRRPGRGTPPRSGRSRGARCRRPGGRQ